MINVIVAHDKNRGIGIKNELPWNVPADLKRFKDLTTGHTVIMGRRTYQSIGKPLPNRHNIVMTGDYGYNLAKGCGVINNIPQLHAYIVANPDEEIFIIGGSMIYRELFDLADRLYVTVINGSYVCDTFFPKFNEDDFTLVDKEEVDECTFLTYERKRV